MSLPATAASSKKSPTDIAWSRATWYLVLSSRFSKQLIRVLCPLDPDHGDVQPGSVSNGEGKSSGALTGFVTVEIEQNARGTPLQQTCPVPR